MPRVSRKQADLNREIIVEAATRLFRERGLHGISVVDVMGAAGLTHGGFYGHFESKEALAQEACSRAFSHSLERWKQKIDDSGDQLSARASIITPYLSAANRDNPGESCPVTAFAGDMCHEATESGLHQTYTQGLEALLQMLTPLMGADQPEANRQRALVDYSLMVGALTLARATRGDALSDEILDAARAFLTVDDTTQKPVTPTL
ncbi:TetR/AcrR family transcriptional regulator [Pseudomonas sp. ANT_J12]|jgi:TetR/AcrR family transcriptional repressor of nem operon|uniref:TetR/AcrR family transcriptional regulator n=1 Tax=Pseudomonas sp. ANT_J12 TaxID=2597351 RepID=UPI0011F2CA59|nr:TetR/AcrR family transcriptional regulator [Pseudomonas sp. ANT_J12]KAA0981754.1 TetR/AcrR family transcriptional regulator [Pseudomonas sp. ANT_J12]